VDPVQEAVAALQAVVTEGVSEGNISENAAEEIQNGLDDALDTFAEGDIEEAVEKLGNLEETIDELVGSGEIAQSEEHKLDKAIEDLAEQMFLAASSEGGD
jgi:polyhydroxyalkanoate synthesis regulator phasin